MLVVDPPANVGMVLPAYAALAHSAKAEMSPWSGVLAVLRLRDACAARIFCLGCGRWYANLECFSTSRAQASVSLSCRRVDIGGGMPLRETEAIVLRTFRLGEADKIVSLLTRQLGRLRGVATGAQRTRSRYGGTLEPLSYVRLWLFERERRDLLRLNSAEMLESFFDMQKDYRMQVATQYLVEVLERFLPEHEVNERAFRLVLAVLRGMKGSQEVTRPLLYFNYWLLRLSGFLPELDRCHNCGGVFGETAAYYGPGSEGLACASCRAPGVRQTIDVKTLGALEAACLVPLDRWLAAEQPPADCREARRFYEEVIASHAEAKLVTRELLAAEV
jgi:DNA repair protein RecO (recombination protein O)